MKFDESSLTHFGLRSNVLVYRPHILVLIPWSQLKMFYKCCTNTSVLCPKCKHVCYTALDAETLQRSRIKFDRTARLLKIDRRHMQNKNVAEMFQ